MASPAQRFRFGEFEVSPETAELRRSGVVVHLEPRVLRVLVYLIRHRDRLVEKSELLDAVWDEAFVTENALTKAIGRLRQALEDDAQEPRCIQTVHSLGYRFIAEISTSPAVEEKPLPRTAAAPAEASATLSWFTLAAVLLGVVTLGIALALTAASMRDWLLDRISRSVRPEIRALAVLPFDNLTGDPDQDYLVAAMHEALITELAQRSPLRVTSRLSTLRYRGSDKAVPEIAAELGVDALVEGSVTRSGERVRVSAQMILGSRDEHLWAGNFDRERGDLLVLLSDLASAICKDIQVALEPTPENERFEALPASSEVEDLYFRARYLLSRGSSDDFRQAQELLTRATALDPGFAPAHAGLASSHFLLGVLGPVPSQLASSEAKKHAKATLELMPESAEAIGVMGMTHLYFDWDWSAAGRELAKAIELSPNDSMIRHGYGDYLLVMGRLEESLEQVKLGRRYDPASPMSISPVVGHLLFLGRYDEVIEEARALLTTDPDLPWLRGFLASALWERGDYTESLNVWRARLVDRPLLTDALERGDRASGPAGAMVALAQQLAASGESGYADPLSVSALYARGGDIDRAFEFLERALEDRSPQLLHLAADPAFSALHFDRRFAELLERIGLPAAKKEPAGNARHVAD